MSDFNLRQLIRDTLDASSDASPHDVAVDVLGAIPAKHLREALAATLPRFVADLSRLAPRGDTGDGHCTTGSHPAAAAPVSSRWEAVKEMRKRIALGDGEWKFLADCTRDDVLRAAAIRRDHASAEMRVAEWFEALADRMAAAGAATVADLGDLDLKDAA